MAEIMEYIEKMEAITGKKVPFYKADILDRVAMEEIFAKEKPGAVIHFAGLKAVGESCAKPLEYYDNNLNSTIVLCQTMREHGVKDIVYIVIAFYFGTQHEAHSVR